MFEDRAIGARTEVKRLITIKVITEIAYLEWLANIVMVKKSNKNGKNALISPI